MKTGSQATRAANRPPPEHGQRSIDNDNWTKNNGWIYHCSADLVLSEGKTGVDKQQGLMK